MTTIFGRLVTHAGKRLTWEQALINMVVLMPDDIGYENGKWVGTPPSKPDDKGSYPIAVPGNNAWFRKLV
jgi:hypothetical protein